MNELITSEKTTILQPLAARMRPKTLDEYVGQQHLLGPGKPLRLAIEHGHAHSMILWGPPGTGKTTLARMIAQYANAEVASLSAVSAGVKDIRAVMSEAEFRQQQTQRGTVLFIDEIHRFNKSQQDALLPYVEDGVVTLIGSTTENPSFELNNALLSRARVYVLKRLTDEDLKHLLDHVLSDSRRGFGQYEITFPENLRDTLIQYADGDARQCLNMLELLVDFSLDEAKVEITEEVLNEVLTHHVRRFDKGGDYFYDLISALHKSIRGSDPDASLYWFSRMLDGGCDALYIARRMVRVASEDIGNADPRALTLALNAWDVQERLGSPEGELAIAQAIVYMACAAKSNAVYKAFGQAMKTVKSTGTLEVPMHIRNAPTKLMKNMGHGDRYRYAHDEPYAYAAGECYFPEELKAQQFYHPVDRGLEKKIKEKLAFLKSLDNHSDDN
ncbi:MAG: replication-associated recombination protein A [Gammaproteobacteria bacterium]